MKTHLFPVVVLFIAFCCGNGDSVTPAQEVSFAIYEIVVQADIPDTVFNSLDTSDIVPEQDINLPVMGYLPVEKAESWKIRRAGNFKILCSSFTVDREGKYCALVAVHLNPSLDNSDVKETRPNKNRVEIFFNAPGSRKWAEMTAGNTGKTVAFSLDNRICSMPLVNARINNGMAIISGLKDEPEAARISELMNKAK